VDLLFTVTDGLRAALGHGDGTFETGVFYPAATMFGPFAADLDDDGRPDVLMLSPSGYAAVFANVSRRRSAGVLGEHAMFANTCFVNDRYC
jgi:hypothetical protein